MSRVGKLPIAVPKNMITELSEDASFISISCLNDKVVYKLHKSVSARLCDGFIYLSSKSTKTNYLGMDRSNLYAAVSGLSSPFKVTLEVNGVGYKFSIANNSLFMSLGYSHDIIYTLPKEVEAKFEKPNLIVLTSHNKVLVGQTASEIMSFRGTDPYKGKGIKLWGKKILRKEGKKK